MEQEMEEGTAYKDGSRLCRFFLCTHAAAAVLKMGHLILRAELCAQLDKNYSRDVSVCLLRLSRYQLSFICG